MRSQKKEPYPLSAENHIFIAEHPYWINNNELAFITENWTSQESKLWLWNSLTNSAKALDFDLGQEWSTSIPNGITWHNEKNLLICKIMDVIKIFKIFGRK